MLRVALLLKVNTTVASIVLGVMVSGVIFRLSIVASDMSRASEGYPY